MAITCDFAHRIFFFPLYFINSFKSFMYKEYSYMIIYTANNFPKWLSAICVVSFFSVATLHVESEFHNQGSNPFPKQWKLRVLTIGPPVQFSSFAQLCLTLCDPMNCSMPGLSVLSQTPEVYPTPCPLSWWRHPTIISSVVPFSSCLQSFPASGSFPMSQPFASGGQSIGASASTSVLPTKTDLLYNGLVGSPCSPRDSQESSLTPPENSPLGIVYNEVFFGLFYQAEILALVFRK